MKPLTTTEYLDAVKKRRSLPSDYALAKLLGLTTAAVVSYRNGRSALGVETAMKIGEILGIDGHKVYSDGQVERAKKPEVRDFWAGISEKFSMGFEKLLSGLGPHGVRLSMR